MLLLAFSMLASALAAPPAQFDEGGVAFEYPARSAVEVQAEGQEMFISVEAPRKLTVQIVVLANEPDEKLAAAGIAQMLTMAPDTGVATAPRPNVFVMRGEVFQNWTLDSVLRGTPLKTSVFPFDAGPHAVLVIVRHPTRKEKAVSTDVLHLLTTLTVDPSEMDSTATH